MAYTVPTASGAWASADFDYEVSGTTLEITKHETDGNLQLEVTCLPSQPDELGKGETAILRFEPELRSSAPPTTATWSTAVHARTRSLTRSATE